MRRGGEEGRGIAACGAKRVWGGWFVRGGSGEEEEQGGEEGAGRSREREIGRRETAGGGVIGIGRRWLFPGYLGFTMVLTFCINQLKHLFLCGFQPLNYLLWCWDSS